MKLIYEQQKVDLSKPVLGKDLDYARYNQKFEVWDYVSSHNFLDSTDPKKVAFAQKLLTDITLFVYSFFKDPEVGTPFKLTAYQDLIGNCAIKHDFTFDNPNRFQLYRAANQGGKSALLDLLAIYLALKSTNNNILMVSKSLPQSQFLMTSIKSFLNNSQFADTWREDVGETSNTTHLTFTRDLVDLKGTKIGSSTNRILCVPAGEGALGYPVHRMFLDELDFYENAKNFFWKVAYPRTNKTKGQIIGFTNPNPDISRSSSILFELWQGDLFQRKFHFTFEDAPWNSAADLEIARKNSPSYIFASTHMGEFPIDGGSFFTQREIDAMLQPDWYNDLPITNEPVFLGLDLAKVHDNSVLGIGVIDKSKDSEYPELHVKYTHKFEQGTDYTVVVDEVKRIADMYNNQYGGVAAIGYDATGVGNAVGDIMTDRGLTAEPVIFSLPMKSKMYANFKMLAEQRRIKIVNDDDCRFQLSNLIFKKTSSGNLATHTEHTTAAHDKESTRDDFPDMLALLAHISLNPDYVEPTVRFF